MGRKTISNEELISCLLSSDSIKEASLIAGITPRTIYKRMKDATFKNLYAEARAQLLKDATEALQKKTSLAVETLANVMTSEDSPPQTKVNSANSILQFASKYTEMTDILERIEKLEDERKDHYEQF